MWWPRRAASFAMLAAVVCGGTAGGVEATSRPSDPTPGAAGVVAKGDFETGDLSQWTWGAQCANTGVASGAGITRGTVHLATRFVGQGRYAARFDLPAVDGRTACELLDRRKIGLGTDDYYGLMLYLPRNWREPSPTGWGLSIAQLGFEGIWGSPVSLQAHAHKIVLATQSGLCNPVTSTSPGCAYASGQGGNLKPLIAVPAPLALHRWIEVIVHVHWATDSSGVVEAWYRLKGQTAWKQTASLRGRPTLQWTPERLSTLGNSWTADKIGAYRAGSPFPVTIWLDGYVRATSFTSAARRLP